MRACASHKAHGCLAWVLLAQLCCCFVADDCNAQREFGGVYTIVNQESGRRLIADERGFYTTSQVSVSSTSMWHVLPDANATHVLQNVATGARVYAQQGADREHGFFVLDGATPVFRDQRWQLDCRARLGVCTITNMKSLRSIIDDHRGLIATAVLGDAPGALWWFLRQDNDEVGQHISRICTLHDEGKAKSMEILSLQARLDEASARLHEAEQKTELAKFQSPVAALVFAATVLLVCMAAMLGRPHLAANSDFQCQMLKTQADGELGRLVRICCPGVRHQDIEVKLVPNGCHLALRRPAMKGLKEIMWQKTLQFDFRDGFFEFVEDQMQLELGYLTLLFRQTHYQDRTIRFAQHFSMDAFDHELVWDLPVGKIPTTSPVKGRGDECASSSKSTASS